MMKKRAALSTLVKNIPDWVIGVPRAILTIALAVGSIFIQQTIVQAAEQTAGKQIKVILEQE